MLPMELGNNTLLGFFDLNTRPSQVRLAKKNSPSLERLLLGQVVNKRNSASKKISASLGIALMLLSLLGFALPSLLGNQSTRTALSFIKPSR
jgi:hypothetical protein